MKLINVLLFVVMSSLVCSCGNDNADNKSSDAYPSVQNADTMGNRNDSDSKNLTNGYTAPGTGETAAGSKDSMQ